MSDIKVEAIMRALNTKLQHNLEQYADKVVVLMKKNLQENGSVDTGNLLHSIRRSEAEYDEDTVSIKIYADARNEVNGAQYAEFVEFGTGEHNEFGDGRQGGWVYRDKDGVFHHTYGQKPKPFIRPALAEAKDVLDEEIRDAVSETLERWYKREN